MRQSDLLLRWGLFFCCLISAFTLKAQVLTIDESLKTNSSAIFSFGGEPTAYLTAGKDDPEGEGWLRLTMDSIYQKGFAIVDRPFLTTTGVLIDLEFKIWRRIKTVSTTGADGFSIFLYDAAVDSFHIGGFGGSLGYAPHVSATKSFPGMTGAYVGIGIDAFGNFCNPTEGRVGGPGFKMNTVSVRASESNDYRWIGGNVNLPFKLDYESSDGKRPTDAVYYRNIQVEIIPNMLNGRVNYTISVRMRRNTTSTFETILEAFELPEAPPEYLKLGFAASTGQLVNYHELRNLKVSTFEGVAVEKTANKSEVNVGDSLMYEIRMINQSESRAENLVLKDSLEALAPYYSVHSIEFDDLGNPDNKVFGFDGKSLSSVRVDLDTLSQAVFRVYGIVTDLPPSKRLVNKVVFAGAESDFLDHNTYNDTSICITPVQKILSDFFIPNVFTPNSDGVNDVFEIVGLAQFDRLELNVFNRWGNEVYANRSYQNDWDGNDLLEGTYYYVIRAWMAGEEYSYKGWVLLKRK